MLHQLTVILLWSFAMNTLQKELDVHLSNSGPVIKGSEIVFKAEVLDGTSHPVQDDKHFMYRWRNTADGFTATTKGYKNTTHKECYDRFISAREYKMTVRVCDLRDNNKCHNIGSAETYFEITEGLNGNLNINQSLQYRNPNTSAIYSTHKPLRLHLNLTDKFKEKPNMDYTWSIDGGTPEVTNTPETDLPIRDTGEHEIRVAARATEKVPDCDYFLTEDVKGQFVETVILKDPVAVNMTGARVISTKDPLVINITLNGSEPFTVCWSSNQSLGLECIDHWCCEEVTNDTQCNITIDNLTAGNYTFNISIANDISKLYRQHNITVSEREFIIKCYITTLVFVGVNVIIVAIQVILIERSCSCMAMSNLWMCVCKVAGPTLAVCIVAIISQIVIYNIAEFKCSVVSGMIIPVTAMVLVEAATIGAMAIYVKRKGKWIVSRKIKVVPISSNNTDTGKWDVSRHMKFVPILSISNSEPGRKYVDGMASAFCQPDESHNLQQHLDKIWTRLFDTNVSPAGPKETQDMASSP